ncbi:MAG: GAF domain-containing protein [Bacteroidota bacterium]
MRRCNSRYFCVLLSVSFYFIFLSDSITLHAQTEAERGLPFITNYSARAYNALPQTWSIQQDDQGIMYFGIQNYLLEYDGVKWRKILLPNTTSTVVRSLAKNDKGVIHYGGLGDIGHLYKDSIGQTAIKSLSYLIPKNNKNFLDVWSTYCTPSGTYYQAREYIFRVTDSAKDGKRAIKVWTPASRFMFAFYIDDTYYVHQQGLGLYKMVNDSLAFIPGSEIMGQERMQIMLPYPAGPDGEKQYLMGLFYSGLYIYNGKTFRPFETKADVVLKAGAIAYKGLSLDKDHYAIGTTGKGLVIIDTKGNLIQQVNREVGLQDESIYGTFLDRKGTLWLALDNGISRVETASPITRFGVQSGITTGVLSINRYKGDLIIGTTNGVLKYNPITAYFEPVPGIPLNQVFNLLPDSNQLLIPGDGLFALRNNRATTLQQSVSGDLSLTALKILAKHPAYLFASGQSGVAVFEKEKLGPSVGHGWKFVGNIPGIDDQIWSFAENADGSVWAGTQNSRVYKISLPFDINGKLQITKVTHQMYGIENGLKNAIGQVTQVFGKNYFHADSSIYTFDEKTKQFLLDTSIINGNVSGGNTEFNMVPDSKGRIWLRFGKEILLGYPKQGGGFSLRETGLNPITELTMQSIYPEDNGIIWFCTTDGLIRYDEKLVKKDEQAFISVLRHITAGKTALNITQEGIKPVSIDYDDNTLRFEYAAPFFEQEEKTRYQTWLEGFEKGYSDFDNNYYKEFTNLPAGDYVFHVRAKNIHDKMSIEGNYRFSILPPLYRTWWAYALYALIIGALLYLVIRWRTRQLHEKHRELEKIVDERTQELSQRASELSVINSVQEGLVKQLDIKGIYELTGERIRNVFDAQALGIATFDHTNNTEQLHYLIEKGQRHYPGPFPLNGIRKRLIQTKEKILINKDFEAVVANMGVEKLEGTEQPKSALYVPLLIGEKVTGYISLQNVDRENAFSAADVRLLETLANSMGVALENARLFDETNRLLKETEQRTAELAVINSVQDGLAKELDMQAIYELVGERIRNVFDAQAVIIASFDETGENEIFNYAIEKGERFYLQPRNCDKLREHLIKTREKILINSNYEKARVDFGMQVLPGTEYPKSLLFVPLIIGGRVRSYVSLQNVDKENAFSDSDVRLLETLANSMSVALENARLFDETSRLLNETEQRTAELAVINSVQEGLAKELDIQGIYELVGDRLCSLFPDTQTLVIRTFDHQNAQENFHYAIEKGLRFPIDARPLNWSSKELIKTRKPLDIRENYVETAIKHGGTGVTKGQPPKSALFVPMIVGDVIRGSISLQNVDKENAFSSSDLRLLTTITNSMTVALENARLFEETSRLLGETKQRASELVTVNNISQALASQLNLDQLIKLVGDEMLQLFKPNIVYLALLDKNTDIISFPYQYGDDLQPLKIGEGLTSKIIKTGKPLLINKDLQELRVQMGVTQIGIPAASYLGVPIPVGENIIGVLSIQSTEHENQFNENDLRLLSTIASSVGAAIQNAQLFEEVKQAKLESEAARKAAEKANHAKSSFLSTVSHELRTPLTSVLGFAKIIKKRLEERIFPLTDVSDPKTGKTIQQVVDNLGVVVSEGERLTHLINDVLDLAKIEAGKMEWNIENVSMAEVAERAIAATSSLFEGNKIKLVKEIDPNLPEIQGDRDKLIQVMVNLVSNSVKFTPEGKVTCRVFRKKGEVVVEICDTGIGIAADDHAAVFEQFKQVGDTLTDKPKGTGLGLPICKEIVEHHGGRIWLESKLGEGSKFYFALPVSKSNEPKPVHIEDLVRQLKEQVAQSKLNGSDNHSKLLIVDDDDSIRSLLNQELTDAGYIIEEAKNGKEALVKIRANRPDLVILDIMMPEMNGFDVAAILKNDPQTMDIPIIVLSILQDKTRGFRIGVDRYLTKPIDTHLLFSEIGNLLEQGKSKKKVMIVDEDSAAVNTLTEVLKTKGYLVLESDEKQMLENAITHQPDIIVMNSVLSGKHDFVTTLRFEKGLENVLFFVYQ